MIKMHFKVIIGFLIFFYLVILTLFYNFYEQLAMKDAKHEVTSILRTTKALRHYVEETQKPIIYKLQDKGNLSKDYFDPKILSSSFIASKMHERYKKIEYELGNKPYQYKLAATNPRSPKNKADEFETEILNKYRNQEINEFSKIIEENGQKYFFSAIPIGANKESCMKCHGDPKDAPKDMIDIYGDKDGFFEKVGDIRAIISLKIPVSNILETHRNSFYIIGFIIFIIFLIFCILVYILYKKDILIQEKNEKLLLHKNKFASMGEMLGNIAHQWRQPLTQLSSILINLELTYDKNKLTKEKFKQKVIEANTQISYMSNTIDDFRDFLLTKKEKDNFYIKDIINILEKFLSITLEKYRIKIIVNIEDNFELYCHRNELIQALINLINNSKDAYLERDIKDRIIKIKTYNTKGKKIIEIHDNAGGIDEKLHEKIFEPNFTTKNQSIGTGIGLYMTKMIIEKNSKGTIKVTNKNKGVLFTIIFET